MAFHHKILGIVTLLYLCLFLIHIIYFAAKKEKIKNVIWFVLYGTFGLQTVGLILRWVESYQLGIGHAPLSNFYESLIFYSWCLSLILVLMKKRLNYPAITVFGALISLFLMGYASISPSIDRNIQPLVPALQSNWLHIHVFTCFIAYASFVVSFICGLLYMFTWKNVGCRPRKSWKRTQLQKRDDRLSHAHRRQSYRGGLGPLCLGILLELGPQRNLVSHHLDRLQRPLSSRPVCQGLEGK